ncbi:antitoxin Xre/MbcA/ParS toxin-binding domain-containing protein [Burkholderia metallica]|uniref:antitoxin Xre/MbcA/ParS toxin-binding domain-containing protein n=1 Tax=Burkholderia metallica TaxID=488729 RepID=UPI00157B204A|nr:antitoxin Xre/MbcA/ParS toxin-binding domain-containing protein [Burkholderia metallica]
MIRLEQYYSGDDVWENFSDLFVKYRDFQGVHDLAMDLNGQLDIAYTIYWVAGPNSARKWINSNVPALDNLRPIDCASNPDLIKRLRECLMRMPS